MTKDDILALGRTVNLHPTPGSYLEASVIEFAGAVAAAERNPLNPSELLEIWDKYGTRFGYAPLMRAVEQAHGIKEAT